MKKYIFSGLIFLSINLSLQAQHIYQIDASNVKTDLIQGHLKMGYSGNANKEIQINNRYLLIGGKPVIPVMGEMHFSRMPRDQWEDAILKMKACGINIVATYVFWIHHEEIEGKFDWSGNKDLRAFLQLCHKHGMYAYPRIGPWCHGEVRNGGTPDWLLLKRNVTERTLHPVYKSYVDRLYNQIARQMDGLLYKDGGPVIGIQLENEYGHGKEGEPYILWLKQTAIKNGMDVPMYTVTGWGDGSVPANEVIPLWGGYPDAPWDPNIERMSGCSNFQFDSFRDDKKIGNDVKKKEGKYMDYSMYPYFTCEMGVGNMNTNHRRLIINPIDGYTMAVAKTGSGSNLLGYYVFVGGSNPVGTLTSMEENQDETGYWNTNPIISYDFMAAIKESGQLAPSYFEVKKLHYFLNEFGERLAPMEPVIGQKSGDLQYAIRVKDNAGFLFGINYCRWTNKPEIRDVQFSIKLKNEDLVIPSHPVTISDSTSFIWPFNFDMNGVKLCYATAQPLCSLEYNKLPIWVFIQDNHAAPEFCFDASTVSDVASSSGKLSKDKGKILVTDLVPGTDCLITLKNSNGKEQKILILSKEEAKHVWLFSENNQKKLFLTDANMYTNGSQLHVYGYSNSFKFKELAVVDSGLLLNGVQLKGMPVGLFTNFEYNVAEKKIHADLKPARILDEAEWLKTSVAIVNKDNLLNHRFFLKEFNLGDPSAIKNARIYIASDERFRIQINNTWVNQSMDTAKLNALDLTGYLRHGENTLMLEFPFSSGEKAFAARVVVDYFNSDRYDFSTDEAWLMCDSYTFPSYLIKNQAYMPPQRGKEIPAMNQSLKDQSEYSFSLPKDCLDSLSNLYLLVRYSGDKAKCRINNLLVADDFNSNVPWCIGINRLGNQAGLQKLKFELSALKSGYKIYFDNPPAETEIDKAEIKEVKLLPEYKLILNMK